MPSICAKIGQNFLLFVQFLHNCLGGNLVRYSFWHRYREGGSRNRLDSVAFFGFLLFTENLAQKL